VLIHKLRIYHTVVYYEQVKEEKIAEEARTRMKMRNENSYLKKMVKVYIDVLLI